MEANKIGAPAQEVMGGGNLEQFFGGHEGLLVKQTMKGCLQEMCGCEAKSEFKIAPMEFGYMANAYQIKSEALEESREVMYAIEESSCCCRLCYRDGRPFTMKVSQGSEAGGDEIVHFVKPCSFPLNFHIPVNDGKSVECPCCCMLPKLSAQTPSGVPLNNESAYICDMNLFVPKLKYSENGEPVYILKPETCCGGCCMACNICSGKGAVFIPFYFHDPNSGEVMFGQYDQEGTPQIRKVWAGLAKECCSTADTFAVFFPPGITPQRKAGLLGLTFLLDFTVFERQQEKGGE